MGSIIFYVGGIAIILGLILDLFNILWGYRSARGIDYKSGIFIIPAVLYCVGASMCIRPFGSSIHLISTFALVVLHLFCFGLIPAVFDKIFVHDQ